MKYSDSLIYIVNYIWKKRDVSIRELTEELFLEKSTISRIISRLRDQGIIIKTGELRPSAQGGRKTNLFTFNYTLSNVLGLQIEQDGIGGVVTDLAGKPKKKFRIKKKIGKENIIKEIKSAFYRTNIEKLTGVGIAIPGILNTKKGEVIFSAALGLKDYPLLEILRKEMGIPIVIENDSNAAVSYYKLKKKNRIKNLIYFLISLPYNISDNVGFGVGMIINGEIYHGNKNLEGEYKLERPLISKKQKGNIYELPHIIKESDAKEEVIDFLDFLAEKIAIILSILDPGISIIGGNITLLPGELLSYLKEKIRANISMWEYRDMEIITTKRDEMIIAKGGASIMLDYFFTTREGLKIFLEKFYGGNNEKR